MQIEKHLLNLSPEKYRDRDSGIWANLYKRRPLEIESGSVKRTFAPAKTLVTRVLASVKTQCVLARFADAARLHFFGAAGARDIVPADVVLGLSAHVFE